MKNRVHEMLEVAPEGDRVSKALDIFIIALILVNATALIISTLYPQDEVPLFFGWLEKTSVSIFVAEYLLRLWACTAEARYSHPIYGRLRFAFSPLLLIDLLAVAPSVLEILLPLLGLNPALDLRFLRAVRLVARAARLSRYFSGIRTLGQVISNKKYEMLTVVIVLGVMLVLASSLMYFAEHQAQPDDFASIPEAMWWSVITLTTVGYGDVSPVTPLGKAMAGVIAIMGIGMFALPAGILGSGFLEEIQQRNRGPQICPHCGGELGD